MYRSLGSFTCVFFFKCLFHAITFNQSTINDEWPITFRLHILHNHRRRREQVFSVFFVSIWVFRRNTLHHHSIRRRSILQAVVYDQVGKGVEHLKVKRITIKCTKLDYSCKFIKKKEGRTRLK